MHVDRAVVQFNQSFGDGQTQTGPFVTAGEWMYVVVELAGTRRFLAASVTAGPHLRGRFGQSGLVESVPAT